jgi:chemotaxis protein methyltransferase CheR
MSSILPATEEEFRRLCEFLYRHTGIIFNETKRYYVERRVLERMVATGAESFSAYFIHLRTDASHEIEHFINALTVNETYFYREEHQLQCLTNDLLRDRLASGGQRGPIRIWSHPCSTGEEPYSIALWLLENWPEVDNHEIEIVGSDIDTRALEAAREGLYGQRALMRLSPELIGKYFVQEDDDHWRIIDDLRNSVHFTRANLVDSGGTRQYGLFDVIFCRNVLIYFDDGARRVAAENLFYNLMAGGFLCLGHTESMSRISPLFEACRFNDAIVYQRPVGSRHG